MSEATTQRQSVSVMEFAAAHNVNQYTVRRLIASGEIPSFRIGRTVRIPIDALPTGRSISGDVA